MDNATRRVASITAKLRRIRSIVTRPNDGSVGQREEGKLWLKTLAVAPLAGLVAGLGSVAVRLGLSLVQLAFTGQKGQLPVVAGHLPLWRRALIPVVGSIIATIIAKVSGKHLKEKFVDYVTAVQKKGGKIAFPPALWKMVTSAFTISSGVTIGREGSMIQFATSAVSLLGQHWKKLPISLKEMVALGSAGGVSSVYDAPLAGVFFTLEIVLGVNSLSWGAIKRMPPLLVSSYTGYLVSTRCLGIGTLFKAVVPQLSRSDIVPTLITGAVIGVAGPVYLHTVKAANSFKKVPLAMVWVGVLVGLFSCLQPDVWGNGDTAIVQVLTGKVAAAVAVSIMMIRLAAVTASVGSGVVGGIFTPTVFNGSVLGLLCATGMQVWFSAHMTAAAYPVIGIGCLLAAVTHAPLMAAFMAIELTGTPHLFPPILVGSLISWQIARRLSEQKLYAATPDPSRSPANHT